MVEIVYFHEKSMTLIIELDGDSTMIYEISYTHTLFNVIVLDIVLKSLRVRL